jgi:hypothetical protein
LAFLGILVFLKRANPLKDGDAKPPIYGNRPKDSGVASVRILELARFVLPVLRWQSGLVCNKSFGKYATAGQRGAL